MKKNLIISISILLIVTPFYSSAQIKVRKTELGIGDKMPDIEFANLINHPKGSVRVSDFKGKALLLDFWAPWCSPCIAAFPKLDALQNKFNDKLQVIPITAESKDFSERSLRNLKKVKNIDPVMSVVDDTIASGLFKPRVFPHYIWVDRNGIIKAITGSEAVTEDNLQDLIDGDALALPIKVDNLIMPQGKPIFASNRVTPRSEQIVFHSLLTKHIQDIHSGSFRRKNWINCMGLPIVLLYKNAFGEFGLDFISNGRVILEGFNTREDSLMIGRYSNQTRNLWKEIRYDNVYNYELVVADTTINPSQLFKYMQDDLNRMFANKGIHGRLEKRIVKSLVLIRTTQEDKLKSAGGPAKDLHSDHYLEIRNKHLYDFTNKIAAYYSAWDTPLPIYDETNYRNKVDMQINANLTDIAAVNKELEKYDLQIIEKEREMDMIVITKKVQ